MNKRQFGKKIIAWSLIAAMLNPAAMLPAYGRDSDIYLVTTSSATTAEPNILITLDTSDSMNLPEAWKEYAPLPTTAVTDEVNYDSHIEYLWNDCLMINCTSPEQVAASATVITTAPATVLTPPGSWAGATLAARQALWTAAKTYAQATQAGDPGVRNIWRNYAALNGVTAPSFWNYWLPAGTPMTDLRLTSLTFNRWAGGVSVLGGTRGGIAYTGFGDFRGNNRCGDSGTDPAVNLGTSFGTGLSSKVDTGRTDVLQGLTPSTVYAPTAAPRNSGRYLNTTWMRWVRFLDLRNGKLATGDTTYPTAGVGATTLPAAGTYPISAGSGMGNTGNNIRGRAETIVPIQNSAAAPLANWGLGTLSTGAVRDTWPAPAPPFGSTSVIGDRGQPIRTQIDTSTFNTVQAGDSRSGWTLPKADMGGFNFADNTFNFFNSGPGVVQLQTILGWYGIVAPASTANNQTLTYAWKGNRDASPSYAITTGTPAYYDSPVTPGTTTVGSTTVTLPSGVNGITVGLIVNIPGAGLGGIPLVTNVTAIAAAGGSMTIGAAATLAVTNTPITRNLRLTTATAGGVLRCTTSWTLDADPGAAGNQAAFTATAPQLDGNNVNRWYLKNGAVCLAPVNVGPDCTGAPAAASTKAPALPGGNNYFTQVFAGCAWSGRTSLYVEGIGTYWYGGTCGSAATCNGPGHVSGAAPCPASSFATHNFGPSSYQTRSFCATSSIADTTIGATQLAGAKLNDAVGGCGNLGNVSLTCQAREGFASCNYVNTNANATLCPNDTLNTAVAPTTNEHTAFVQVANDNTLIHDCTADDGTAYNPSSGYLNGRTDRLFNTAYNLTVSTTANVGDSYTTAAGTTITGQPAIDTYSTNYMNWKFGPKGPSGYPIGRKTRLQIAKDALTSLVATTDGVRFGLMVFNRTAGCTSTNTGSIDVVASNTTLNLTDNPGFVGGQPITIFGAGPGGVNLNTTITTVAPNVLDPTKTDVRFSPAASTSVASAQVTANPCSGSVSNDGANVAQRILRMGSNAADTPDFNNRATLTAAINAVTANSRTPLTETLYEAYRYFSGRVPRFGVSTAAALAGGTVTQGRDAAAVCTVAGAGCPAIGLYRSPMLNNPNTTTPAGCQKNFVVLITDGGPEDDWAANSDIKRLSQAGVLGTVSPRTTLDATSAPGTTSDQFETSALPYGPTDLSGPTFDGGYIWLDELAYFLGHADISPGATALPGDTGPDRLIGRQSVVTYTIGFAGGDSPVLQNASAHSGGGYYLAEDSTALASALLAAIAAIRDWDPTAAAATVPISVLNRAENATDVYLAFFQPDPSSAWLGTVKKFKLSSDPTDCGGADKVPCLIGQTTLTKSAPNPSPAKNIETITDEPVTGTQSVAVDTNASSLWAPTSVADGGRPNQGGTGYQLINTAGYDPSTRNVYTFISGTSSSVDLTVASNAVKEANTNIDKCKLGDAVACVTPATPVMTDAARATLINFARGGSPSAGTCSDADPLTACTTWRAWPHAAVEHSKPIIVTYDGTPTGSPARATTQYLYFLSNDGLLHAVDTFTGKEKWAFLIEEALPQINALMADTAGQENSLADGGLSVYQSDDDGNGIVDGADKVWLYFGLRRGGRAYYALDITLKDAPRFKWKITANSGGGKLCSGLGACTANADYNELGQTWSAPTVGKIRALGISVPALVFGGGYDPNQDTVPPAVTADSMGRAVYVVNGDTGATVRWFGSAGSVPVAGMNFSIPSDVTALNTDSDSQGFFDRLYVGDMGGNVWRFDIDSATLTSWTGKQLADLSGATTPKRKIFFPPAAVKRDVPERFDAVYIGTGDREHPLNTQATAVTSARDAIFMIMDRDVGLTSGAALATYPTDFVLVANDCLTGCVDPAALTTKKGWARDLQTDCTPDAAGIISCGEKVISPPTVFSLKLRFGTYAPNAQSNACTPPGEGRLNEIDAVTGDLSNLNTADGLTAADRYYSSTGRGYPSASVVIVLGKNVYLVTILDGAPKFQLLGTIGNATKIYWYMEPEQ